MANGSVIPKRVSQTFAFDWRCTPLLEIFARNQRKIGPNNFGSHHHKLRHADWISYRLPSSVRPTAKDVGWFARRLVCFFVDCFTPWFCERARAQHKTLATTSTTLVGHIVSRPLLSSSCQRAVLTAPVFRQNRRRTT